MTVHTCGRPDCARKHHAKGLCKLHWRQVRTPPRPRAAAKQGATATKPVKAPTPPARKPAPPAAPKQQPARKPITKLRDIPASRPLTQAEKDLTMRLLCRYAVADLADMLGVAA